MNIDDQLIPILVMYKGVLAGHRWPVQSKSMTIGRSNDCEIVLPERQISRYHARIEDTSDGYLLRDLGSKNGTFVNDHKLVEEPHLLRDGDEISLANIVNFGFIAGEATLPLEEIAIGSGKLAVNPLTKHVSLGSRVLDPPLSPAQFALLSLLMEAKGRIVSREEVISIIWPTAEGGVTDQAVDALVYRLRERLAELDPEYNYVTTMRGHGFRFA